MAKMRQVNSKKERTSKTIKTLDRFNVLGLTLGFGITTSVPYKKNEPDRRVRLFRRAAFSRTVMYAR
jgi:hypothetical protein